MSPVYKCDFCNYIGTAEAVEAHEKVCKYNPTVKHCYTCVHCTLRPGCFAELTECSLNDVVRSGLLECPVYEQGQPTRIIAV